MQLFRTNAVYRDVCELERPNTANVQVMMVVGHRRSGTLFPPSEILAEVQ
ncbi:hypothetical protein R2A130_2831 [Ahrensia sp. R2A130]|nr:hypothetical protein R2A130_2831 [Ahrensia sp. R2A130]